MRRLAGVVLAVAAALSASGPAPATSRNATVVMSDGVSLDVTLSMPDGAPPPGGWPVVMLLHGLGATRTTPYAGTTVQGIADDVLVPAGYAALTFDARGHGASGGLSSLDGEREIQDVRELLSWLREQPGVDASNVGAFGISLGAGAVLRAAAEGVQFKAIVPVVGWTNLLTALAPNGLSKSGLVIRLFSLVPADRWSPEILALAPEAVRGTDEPLLERFANERSVAGQLGRISTPTFVIQGRRDFAFDMAQARTAFRRLAGPKRVYLGDLGHAPATNPVAEQSHYTGEILAWFDRWLKGTPNGIDTRPPVEVAADPWTGRTAEYESFPATRTVSLTLRGRRALRRSGKAAWTLELPRKRLESFGAATVRLRVATPTSWPNLVAVISAVAPGGRETIVSEGGTRLTKRKGTVSFRLIDDAALLRPGTRLKLTVAASTTAQDPANLLYLNVGMPANARLTVAGGSVRLPVLKKPLSR